MKRNDGGQAFPLPDTRECAGHDGMSLRDYFAAHAPKMDNEWASFRREDWSPSDVPLMELRLMATWRYAYADIMIAERDRK